MAAEDEVREAEQRWMQAVVDKDRAYAQERSVPGHEWSGRFVMTDVWVRREGRWQVVARHSRQPPHRSFVDES